MLKSTLALALSCFALPSALAASSSFENSAITRTFDLGGSTSLVTTVYNVKTLDESAKAYELALGGADEEEPSWWEVVAGGKMLESLQVSGGDGRS
jgi:oligosaccharyltransferase complex subunit alpha (ribophorin I)